MPVCSWDWPTHLFDSEPGFFSSRKRACKSWYRAPNYLFLVGARAAGFLVRISCIFLWSRGGRRGIAQAITAPGNLNDLGLLQKAIENSGGRRHVTEQQSPLLDRPVGGHKRGAILVAAHHQLQEYLGTLGWEMLHAKIINTD